VKKITSLTEVTAVNNKATSQKKNRVSEYYLKSFACRPKIALNILINLARTWPDLQKRLLGIVRLNKIYGMGA